MSYEWSFIAEKYGDHRRRKFVNYLSDYLIILKYIKIRKTDYNFIKGKCNDRKMQVANFKTRFDSVWDAKKNRNIVKVPPKTYKEDGVLSDERRIYEESLDNL